MPISDAREVPRRNEALLAKHLTEIIDCGIDTVEGGPAVADLGVELVLCKDLILESNDRWCVNSLSGVRRHLRGLHSVRFRYGTRWADRNATHLLKSRLATLASDSSAPVGVRWPIDESLADSPEATPITVVHCAQAAAVRWWEHRNVVCAAFTRRPKSVRKPLRGRGGPRGNPGAAGGGRAVPVLDALDFGIPYLMWPNAEGVEVPGQEILDHLEKCRRPEHLNDYLRRRAQLDYSVVADCRDSPLPRDHAYISEVRATPGGQ